MYIAGADRLPYVPEEFETERLLMRTPRMGDGEVVNAAIQESFEELTVWMPWARVMPSIAETETFMREAGARYRTREELALLLFRKEDGVFIGSTGVHHIDWSVPRFEIGYWVRTAVQGQGYITEAVVFLTDYLFDHLNAERVEIRCDTRNQRSAAVAERAGYTLEATFRRDRRDNAGNICDTFIFARIREEDED